MVQPIPIRPQDDGLAVLQGMDIVSPGVPEVSYRIGTTVGKGGMCVAFYALRVAPDGQCPVVIKMVRPSFARQSPHALLIAQKEVVALRRLNERVPPTPFIVRLVDAGALTVEQGRGTIELPWLALEYVHGGAEGTTLSQRVKHAVQLSGHAFDLTRAVRAIECITQALAVVHEVGVIHRDIKPDNILCCGTGAEEIFKVADFGVARPVGLAETFKGSLFGTPGYAAPEMQAQEASEIGPWTDVFSLAPTLFFLLTGELYFQARTALEHITSIADSSRRSLLDAPALSPELRARAGTCRAIDVELARATSIDARRRHQSADALGLSILRLLPSEPRQARRPARAPVAPLEDTVLLADSQTWTWTIRHHPTQRHRVERVAWDGDGRCLALGDHGLSFWNGTSWCEAPLDHLLEAPSIHFVHRTGPGRWIVGGDAATVAAYTTDGAGGILRGVDASISYRLFSGDLNDLGVVVGSRSGSPPALYALVGGWWLKPLPLVDVETVAALARVDRARWLVAGERTGGGGFAALYSPLDWELADLATRTTSAFAACAGNVDRRVGLAVGARGAIVRYDGEDVWLDTLDDRQDLSAAGVDPEGGCWAGCAGRLWRREAGARTAGSWELVWEDPRWGAPVVSILADVGQVIAVTADGGVLEGRRDAGPRAM